MKAAFFLLAMLELSLGNATAQTVDDDPMRIGIDPLWKNPPQLVEDLTPLIMDNPETVQYAGTHIERSSDGPPMLMISHEVNSHYPLGRYIFTLNLPKITTSHYAVIGEMRYANIRAGSSLSLDSSFASGGDAFSSPRTTIEGTGDFRPFMLPFIAYDPTGEQDPSHKLVQLRMYLDVEGPDKKDADESVVLRNLKLVQYPDAPQVSSVPSVPSAPLPPGATTTEPASSLTTDYQMAKGHLEKLQAEMARMYQRLGPEHPTVVALHSQIQRQQLLLDNLQTQINQQQSLIIDWKSFLLGVTTTGLALLATTALLFLSRRWQHRRNERELRRIASLDS
jgi:hypothetical protein